jgi:hypothetical protein
MSYTPVPAGGIEPFHDGATTRWRHGLHNWAFCGERKCPGRRLNPWTSVSSSLPASWTGKRWRRCAASSRAAVPKPRQRGFNSFLARHNRSGRAQRVARIARCSMSALGYRVEVCLPPNRVGEFRRHPRRVKRARHVRYRDDPPSLLSVKLLPRLPGAGPRT